MLEPCSLASSTHNSTPPPRTRPGPVHREHGQPELHRHPQEGQKFSDGTEVKAANFVKAWNWNRAGKNGTLNSYFFDMIDGSAGHGLWPGQTRTATKSPTATRSRPRPRTSGLKIVDDYTFTIKTTEKVSTCRCDSATPPSPRS